MKWKHLLWIALSVLPIAKAHASDGIVEINQSCWPTGCFPGDEPGLPITITQPGSYRLTSNVGVALNPLNPSLNTNLIEISSSSVSLDLAGFRIGCTPSVFSPRCAGSGSGVGVSDFDVDGTELKNGSITGFGNAGAQLGRSSHAKDLRIDNNGFGLRTGLGSIVTRVSARGNDLGISAAGRATVSDCSLKDNLSSGLSAGNDSTLRFNTAHGNGNVGLSCGGACALQGNTSNENGDDGISAGTASNVVGNTARGNEGDGIQANTHSLVRDNVSYQNTYFGLRLGNGAVFRDNQVRSNGNTVTDLAGGSPINGGGNVCDGNTACPIVP